MPAAFADASASRQVLDAGRFPARAIEVGPPRGALWRRALRAAHLRCRCTARFDRHHLRSRLADQGHRDDDARDARGRRRPARGSTIRCRAGFRSGAATIATTSRSRDLLAHASGLTAVPAVFPRLHAGASEFERAICSLPLEYAPRTQSIYSDLGFMLLGFILEDARAAQRAFAGAPGAVDPARRLDAQFGASRRLFTAEPLTFNPPRRMARAHRADRAGSVARAACWSARCTTRTRGRSAAPPGTPACSAPSAPSASSRARVLATLGGRRVLARSRRRCGDSSARSGVPGSSRALGWDTMLPTSSCGTRHVAARSATRGSPARRCGSTGSAISTSCC